VVTRGLYQVNPCQLKPTASGLSGLIPASLDYSKWLVQVNPCQFEL